MGLIALAEGKLDQAITFCSKALQLLPGTGDLASEILSRGTISAIYLYKNELDLAKINALQAAETIFRSAPTTFPANLGYSRTIETLLEL